MSLAQKKVILQLKVNLRKSNRETQERVRCCFEGMKLAIAKIENIDTAISQILPTYKGLVGFSQAAIFLGG